MYDVEVRISLKMGVDDPEGANTKKTLHLLGYKTVKDVKTEKIFMLTIDAESREDAYQVAVEIADRLLSNPVVHSYSVRVLKG